MNDIRYDEQLVADLFDAQPQPVFWMRPVWNSNGSAIVDFEYVYCNEEMFRYTGLSAEQLIGTRVTTTLTLKDDLRQEVLQQMIDVFQSGKRFQSTLFNAKLNKYYSFLRSRIQDGVLTVIQDRTSEYEMIRELQQQKNLLNNILKYSPSGIAVTEMIRNENGDVTDAITKLANDAAIQSTGLPKENILNQSIRTIDPGIFDDPLHQMVLDTLRTGQPFRTELYMKTTDRWVELSVSRMDEDHAVNVFTDITAAKKVQLDLEQAVSQLNLVVNTSQAGLFTLRPIEDDKGEVVDFYFGLVNQSVASYIGEKAEDLTGSLASIYFPAYKENGLFDIYKDTFLNGTIHQFDFHYEDGYDVFFNIHTAKSGNEILVTFTDHTTLKRLQRELESSIEELRRSNGNLEEFAYAASHDLKEPIRKINYFSDRLKESLKTRLQPEEEKLFERMQTATERMRLLVDDLLTYSQVSVRPPGFESADLNLLMKQVTGDLELAIDEKKAVIRIDELPVIEGYAHQLQQLFQNLLGNALKYSRPGVPPAINVQYRKVLGKEGGVTLSQDDQHRPFHCIEVHDNGIGFEQKDAERIFQVFQRLHGNAEYRGTGVGLAIARKVAGNHRGYLTATSKPGEGSVFRLLLPA